MLHRDLLRCRGFYGFMTGQDGHGVSYTTERLAELGMEPGIRQLPVVDYLDIEDKDYVDALLKEVLEEDRARFREYLSHRHLGLGLITAVSFSLHPI